MSNRLVLPRFSSNQSQKNEHALGTAHVLNDLGRRSARGGAIALVAQGARSGLQIVSAAILARLLQPADFGLVAMATVVTGFAGLFTDLGLSAATVQQKQLDQDTASALFFINLLFGIAAMVVCVALAPAAAWFFADQRLLWVVIAIAFTIPIAALAVQHCALPARGMRWATLQWIGVLAQLLGIVVGVTVAFSTALGYWALVWSVWASTMGNLVFAWMACPWRPSLPKQWQNVASAVNFGLYLTGFNVTLFLARQANVVLLRRRWALPKRDIILGHTH